MAHHQTIRKFGIFRWILTILSLLIVVSGCAYLVGSWQLFRTHFGDNVTINGIDVSRMSKEKAYRTVNSLGNNWMVLRDGKIYTTHYRTANDFITKKEINQYFNQQYSMFGNDKSWNFAPRNLTRDRKALERLNHEKVKYRINGHDYTFRATELFDVIHYGNGHYQFMSDDGYHKKIKEINAKEATINKKYEFIDPDGKQIQVKNKTYGWEIDVDATEAALKKAFNSDLGVVDGGKYIKGKGYTTKGTGYNVPTNKGLGKDYVVVSIKQQKMWIFKDNRPVVTLDDVVTGTNDPKAHDATPTGVWYIMYKQSPSTLRGKNNDGTPYASKVQYWIPFTQSGCGLHDASWRNDWSKQAYQNGGSHGCVNIKPSQIKQVWDNVYQYEPVIVY